MREGGRAGYGGGEEAAWGAGRIGEGAGSWHLHSNGDNWQCQATVAYMRMPHAACAQVLFKHHDPLSFSLEQLQDFLAVSQVSHKAV